jgi:hypothetical protein
MILLFMFSVVARMTGTGNHIQLFLLRWSLQNLLPELGWNLDPLDLHLHIARITGVSYRHLAQGFFLR